MAELSPRLMLVICLDFWILPLNIIVSDVRAQNDLVLTNIAFQKNRAYELYF